MIDEPQILAATSAVLPPSARRGSEGLARPNTPGNFQRGQTTTVRTASRGSLLARIAAPLCILFGLLYFAGAQWYYASTESASQPTRHAQKAIEDVRLHNRLAGHNPLAHDTDRDVPEPTPETHRQVRLELIKEDGSPLKMTFSRSLDWIEAVEASPGEMIFVDLPEMGALGSAKVLSIELCPPVPSGPGNLVTGIFEHQSDNVIDLYLAGATEPIGCTENHRFWSEDREDYVEADELRQGEKIWTQQLGITTVTTNIPRPGTHRVYNLEVHGEHVYEVGDLGVLVHNNYGTGGVLPVRVGQAGESVSTGVTGLPKNTRRIPSASGKKAYRTPDHMDDSQQYIAETKNKNSQYLSSQILDYKAHVSRGGLPGRVDVIIDKRTTITLPLLREHLNPGSPVKVIVEALNGP